MIATPTFAASARKPTLPIVKASGVVPWLRFHKVLPITKTPNPAMHAALNSEALARTDSAMPTTASDSA